MAANPYEAAPLYIAEVDPATGLVTRAFYFLGTAPAAVLAAARRARASTGDARRPEWTVADGATLRGFYGGRWRDLLTPEDPPAPDPLTELRTSTRAPTFFTGGRGDLDFGALDELDDVEAAAPGATAAAPGVPPREVAISNWANHSWNLAAGLPVYTDLAVYAEDTIFDLRLKLRVAAGVPLYRQHLFYYVNEEGPAVPYRLTLDGAPVLADWRALGRGAARPAAGTTVVAGVAVDPRFEERREGIRVEALDTFTLLGPVPGVRVTRVYYVDLFTVIPPLGSAERPNDSLAAVLRDRYQFDLLYYGGLLRYWPQLSPDACSVALSEPSRLAAAYPALDPDPTALRARFVAERTAANRALAWRPLTAGSRQTTAVTAATVRVAPAAARMRVAVRNVFDWIPTGGGVAAVRAQFDVGLPDGAEAQHSGGLTPVVATKRHVSSFNPRAAPAIDKFVGRPPLSGSVTYALARHESASASGVPASGFANQPIPYAYLTVHADGRTEASADWREDDRVGFEAVTAEIATIVGPTLGAINAMGAAAFPIGGALAPPGQVLTALGAITVSAFWPHALTAAAFREVKDRFRAYEKAGIVGIRGLQQAGAYTFNFRRGVVAYDPRLADRAGGEHQNQYARLTDNNVAPRWAAAFQGRAVRVFHRATDLRVEVIGADSLAEFELIRRYVFSFLDSLTVGADRIRAQAADATPAAGGLLRRLQERDPNLFDLKKYNPGATVYSVLCQSGRQPLIHSEAELAAMGVKRRAALVQYWNFTEAAPAFYECPDPKFPHLSFRAGQHPLGYCLPCCKKTRPPSASRAALVNKGCLALHAAPGGHREATLARAAVSLTDEGSEEAAAAAAAADAAADAAASRHVLTYGKPIPAGRISDPPREVGEGLFFGALPTPLHLYLVGVEQSAPAVPNAGFAYSLAFAIGLGDDTADEVLSELAELAAEMGDTFYALGNGGGAAFSSARDLAGAILGAFVRRDADLSPLGPGGAAADTWPYILADLARHAYGVEVVMIADPVGGGSAVVEAAPAAAAAITAAAAAGARPRIALLAVGPSGTYPLAALDAKFYLRVSPSDRWMAARRTFGGPAEDGDEFARLQGPADLITDRIADIIRDVLAPRQPVRGPPQATGIDLGVVTRWANALPAGSAFAVVMRLVNLHNLCYGVLIRGPLGLAYIPVHHSAYPVDGTAALFGPRPAGAMPAAALAAVVASLNGYIAGASEPYAPVERTAAIVNAEGQVTGFISSLAGGEPLHFFHDAAEGKDELPPIAYSPGAVRFPYDSREVDTAIIALLRGAREADLPAAAAAAARNRLYRLFLAEFSAVLRAERNEAIRGQLAAVLKMTRYESAESVAALRRRLVEILRDYPDDLQTVRGAVARAYITAPQDPGGAALSAVTATSFTFDRQTMARLRALDSHGETASALRSLMAERVAPAADAPGALANMYVSCAEASALHSGPGLCVGRRLAVPAERLDDFYDILAADARNPSKAGLLAAISAGVLDPLDFIRRPGERLEITLSG